MVNMAGLCGTNQDSCTTEESSEKMNIVYEYLKEFLKNDQLKWSIHKYISLLDIFGVSDSKYVHAYIDLFLFFASKWSGLSVIRRKALDKKPVKIQPHFVEQFQKYMQAKINAVKENEELFVNDSSSNVTDTDSSKPKYTIVLKGPPKMFNSLLFTVEGSDIIMSSHAPVGWRKLNFKQIINYPSVIVQLCIGDLCFIRGCVPHYKRILNVESIPPQTKIEKKFYNTTRMREDQPVQVYSYNYFSVYIKHLKRLLPRSCQRTLEICTVLDEFLQDISEVNMHDKKVFATNTSVCFSAGSERFARSKKFITNMKEVVFSEIITPRLSVSLEKFNPVQEETGNKISFVTLNELAKRTEGVTASLKYCCYVCRDPFHNCVELEDHLRTVHTAEQPVVCLRCCANVYVDQLANSRWIHKC